MTIQCRNSRRAGRLRVRFACVVCGLKRISLKRLAASCPRLRNSLGETCTEERATLFVALRHNWRGIGPDVALPQLLTGRRGPATELHDPLAARRPMSDTEHPIPEFYRKAAEQVRQLARQARSTDRLLNGYP